MSSLSALIANFREYDAPFATRVRLALSNSATKVRTRQACCGHPGEPGC